MNQQELRSFVIVGGGAIGWMTAAVIANALKGSRVKVTVVEPPGTPAPGVAQSTLPQTLSFHLQHGINEPHLMNHNQGTFRLGTRFVDWNLPGHSYFNPIGAHGASIEFVAFHNYVTKARQRGDERSFNGYSLAAAAAAQGKFCHPVNDPNSVVSTLRYALHLDPAAYGGYFRTLAESHGASCLVEPVVAVNRNKDSGFIESLTLGDGVNLSADFFVDCGGHEGVLIGADLPSDYQDWAHWLPANRWVAVSSPGVSHPEPQTTVTALANGWLRRIPLRQRVDFQLVYNDAHLGDDEAASMLLEQAPTGSGHPVAGIFQSGIRKQLWVGNCLALGPAAGDFEPLQMSDLHLAQTGLSRFLGLLPDRSCSRALANQYNRVTHAEYQNIRDFLMAHYQSVKRDEAFWQDCRSVSLPDSLQHRLELFRVHGQVAFYEEETFPEPSWVSLWMGQHQWPDGYDPVLDGYDFVRLKGRFDTMRRLITEAVASMPDHEDYLARFCSSVTTGYA